MVINTHLGLQLLLVHISVLAHQHGVGGGLCSGLGSPLAQTHSATQDTGTHDEHNINMGLGDMTSTQLRFI